MPKIKLQTIIKAEIEICFDLARSIDFHMLSTSGTKEKAIGGRTSGLISLGEEVTWRATHFGIRQTLTSKITEFSRPYHFRDIQLKGPFRYIQHDHRFSTENDFTVMEDIFEFQSPYGLAGNLFDQLILTKYLTRFLAKRNGLIQWYAESGKWKEVLK